jgi:hypothetical protein
VVQLQPLPSARVCAANACGTIGLVHAVANTSTHTGGTVELTRGSFFDRFVKSTLAQTPDARAAELEKDDSVSGGRGGGGE